MSAGLGRGNVVTKSELGFIIIRVFALFCFFHAFTVFVTRLAPTYFYGDGNPAILIVHYGAFFLVYALFSMLFWFFASSLGRFFYEGWQRG